MGIEVSKANDVPARLAQDEFTKGLDPIPTTPELWAARRRPLPTEEIKVCQRKPGDLFWQATVSRPDFCARLERIASSTNSLRSGNIYRIAARAKV